MYTRQCPKCDKVIHYKHLKSYKRAVELNKLCKSCANIGKKFTQDHKDKLSEKGKLKIGEKNPFFGKHHSEKTKQYYSNLYKGVPMSEIHKQSIKDGLKKSDRCINKRSNLYYWNKKYTPEEILEKIDKFKKNLSIAVSGEKNPMYGKPSPQGSGSGWSGWYKGWFFRSLKELSYMIYVIERFNLKWESAEQLKYRIKYLDYQNISKCYHSDFIINEKYLVEIKPKNLWNSDTVKRKKEAALEFCKKNNLKYKLTESPKSIKFDDLKILVKKGLIVFTKKYQQKFNNYES